MTQHLDWEMRVSRLVICIGAPKSATTFLFNELARDHRIVTPITKELHFWTANAKRMHPRLLKRSNSQYRRNVAKLPYNLIKKGPEALSTLRKWRDLCALRAAGPGSAEAYRRVLGPTTSQQHVAFEATPDYDLLDQNSFMQMARFHPNTHLVYVVRDPVQRMWSGVAWGARHQMRKGENDDVRMHHLFLKQLSDENSLEFKHSNYPVILDRLQSCGITDNLHVIFMENMLAGKENEKLSHAFGFEANLDPKRMSNRNLSKPRQIPKEIKQEALVRMEDIYAEMKRLFPGRIPESWQL